MEESSPDFSDRIMPQEQIFIDMRAQGMSLVGAAKYAKFRQKSGPGLIAAAKRVLRKYGLLASKDDIQRDVGVTEFNVLREGRAAKRYLWAKKDMKNWVPVHKMDLIMLGLISAKDLEVDRGAMIIVRTEGEAQATKQDKKLASVASIPAAAD